LIAERRTLLSVILAAGCCWLANPLLAADENASEAAAASFTSLSTEMTAAEFKAAGLDKLSDIELAALDAWIRQSRQPPQTNEVIAAEPAPPAAVITPVDNAKAVAGEASDSEPAASESEVAMAEAAARAAQADAQAALAAALAAEAAAREQAQAAEQRQQAAQAAAAEAQAAADRKAARAAAIAEQPFQNGRWVGEKPDQVRARIDGNFDGWRGDTLFVLDNGEIWKQRLQGQYFYSAERPEILITRNLLGFYSMEVLETGKSVGVKRVR